MYSPQDHNEDTATQIRQLWNELRSLSERFRRHKHDDIETDALPISDVDLTFNITGILPIANGGTGDSQHRLFVPATAMAHDIAGLMSLVQAGPASLWVVGQFANAANTRGIAHVKVPTGATVISAIKVHYDSLAGSATNLYLQFETSHFGPDDGDGATSDTGAGYATYAGSGTSDKHGIITVPSSSYDGITIEAGGLLNLFIQRDATHLNDTYEDAWNLLGVEFIFT